MDFLAKHFMNFLLIKSALDHNKNNKILRNNSHQKYEDTLDTCIKGLEYGIENDVLSNTNIYDYSKIKKKIELQRIKNLEKYAIVFQKMTSSGILLNSEVEVLKIEKEKIDSYLANFKILQKKIDKRLSQLIYYCAYSFQTFSPIMFFSFKNNGEWKKIDSNYNEKHSFLSDFDDYECIEMYAFPNWIFYRRKINQKALLAVHDSSLIDKNFEFGNMVVIKKDCVIKQNVCIKSNTLIDKGCIIHTSTYIGEECLIFQNVEIYERVFIDNGNIILPNTKIGEAYCFPNPINIESKDDNQFQKEKIFLNQVKKNFKTYVGTENFIGRNVILYEFSVIRNCNFIDSNSIIHSFVNINSENFIFQNVEFKKDIKISSNNLIAKNLLLTENIENDFTICIKNVESNLIYK